MHYTFLALNNLYLMNDRLSTHALIELDRETPSQVSFLMEHMGQQPSKRLLGQCGVRNRRVLPPEDFNLS